MHLVATCLASTWHKPSQAVRVSNAQQSLTTLQAIDIAGFDIDPAFAMHFAMACVITGQCKACRM